MLVQLFMLVLAVVGHSLARYDAEEEINDLREMYGVDSFMDVPCEPGDYACQNMDESEAYSIFGSNGYCDPTLGCFKMNGVFATRPINFKPHPRNVVNTQFTLYTRSNILHGHSLMADESSTISESPFNSQNPTKFIVHGFTDSGDAPWLEEMTEEFLALQDMNVVKVGWGGLGGSKTAYAQATANIRVVAREIVYMLKSLKQLKSLSYQDVHLIGHSLGAHCMGYVGQNLTGLIYRISGLDPADPYFQGYDVDLRLDRFDAQFVDVIHSDSDSYLETLKGHIGGFGTNELSGHVDFFPNGGELQPDCEKSVLENVKEQPNLTEVLRMQFACNHQRSVTYFTESINNCHFTGVLCSQYSDYKADKCSLNCNTSIDHCNYMGYHAFKPLTSGAKKYYLHTMGDDLSYCANDYQITITLAPSSPELATFLEVDVQYKRGLKQTIILNEDKSSIKGGHSKSFVIGLASQGGLPLSLEVKPVVASSVVKTVTKGCTRLTSFCPSPLKIEQIEFNDGNEQQFYFCGVGHTYTYEKFSPMFFSESKCT